MAEIAEPEKFQYRRMPAAIRKIEKIDPENDIRVRLTGRVVDKRDKTIVIDDGSGTADIIAEELFDKADTGDVVRVFCRVIPLEKGYELRAEIIQDMKGLDLDLYKKIYG